MVELSLAIWVSALCVAFSAGLIKGTTGFGMPMIMITGMGSFLAPELALAGLILPTLVTNGLQALRGGFGAMMISMKGHWLFLALVLGFILLSAQLVRILPQSVFFLVLGVPVTLFAAAQLMGWEIRFPDGMRRRVEIVAATTAGLMGGISGVWGPPTLAYLTALNTTKADMVRIQGVVYGLGSVALLLAHIRSGIFNFSTAPFSALLLVPALIGLYGGFRIQDRLDQARFRKVILFVLFVAGLNLIRRGLLG